MPKFMWVIGDSEMYIMYKSVFPQSFGIFWTQGKNLYFV